MSPKVAVIGAGIVGCSTAFAIKRDHPEYDVTIVAENFSPYVTSDGAPGYFILGDKWGDDNPGLRRRWALDTLQWLKTLHEDPSAFRYGVTRCSGYYLSDCKKEVPECASLYPDFRVITQQELATFPSKVKSGFFLTTFVCESSRYLPYLLKRFQDMGGQKLQKRISSFNELHDFDVVVNCSGIGAKELCQDKEVYPIRGQIIRVKAPWIRHFYKFHQQSVGNVIYVYPNNEFAVLGGTSQVGNFNREVNQEDKQMIKSETSLLVPSVKEAEEICDWVGLRPGRTSVRLEVEEFSLPQGRRIKIVHNYGHGRLGISLHYGCALMAAKLVSDCFKVTRQEMAGDLGGVSTELSSGKPLLLKNERSKL